MMLSFLFHLQIKLLASLNSLKRDWGYKKQTDKDIIEKLISGAGKIFKREKSYSDDDV